MTFAEHLERPRSCFPTLWVFGNTRCLSLSLVLLLQVPDAAGERGGPQPSEPALAGYPDAAGSSGRRPWERDRAHGEWDQPVDALGGEPSSGDGGVPAPEARRQSPAQRCYFFPCVWHKEWRQNDFLFQNTRKSETYLKCLINHLNCLLPLPLPLHQGNICLCVKPRLLRL